MPKIEFRDSFKLVLPEEEQLKEFKDFSGDSGPKKKLRVAIDATHAGITNLNSRFYIPSFMEDGVDRLSKGKPRPILKHHKGDQDPVGKLVGAEYVHTVPNELADVAPEVASLVDQTASLKKKVRSARKFIKRGVAAAEDWKGLGYARLYADISDDKAVDQLEKGLFDSVSVGFTSDHAFCSICGADWLDDEDGFCEHFPPGGVYENEDGEKEKQYIIPGKMDIKECSLVNFDADPLTNISIEGYDFGDVDDKEISQDCLFDSKSTWSVQDSKEESSMKLTVNGEKIELTDRAAEVFKLLKKKFESDADSYVLEATKKILSDTEDVSDEKAAESYENSRAEDQKVGAYASVEEEIDKMVSDGELTEEEAKDAKLSSKERKGLPESVFCGPDRSFPVNDKAHCTAARRLIGRYKGPGDKSKIKACIERKCKALGVDDSDTDTRSSAPCPAEKQEGKSNDDLLADFYATEAEVIRRGLKPERPCSQCADNMKKADEALSEIGGVREKLEDAEKTLGVLRDELRLCSADMRSAVNESIDVRQELDLMKKDYASLLAVLNKDKDSLEQAKAFFDEVEDFEKEYKKLTDSFDLDGFVVNFSSGMDHKPEGMVKTPLVSGDLDNSQKPSGLSKPAQAAIQTIKDFVSDGNKDRALALFNKMRVFGVFADDVKFEDLIDSTNADE